MTMRFNGVPVRFFRVLMGSGGMFMTRFMVALFVMFRCCVMGLRGMLVMLCCLSVRFMCHDRHLLFGFPKNNWSPC